jgi:hypothetical protein
MRIGQTNFKGNIMLKLKDIIIESPADEDLKAAEKIRHDLEDAIGLIDKQMIVIDQRLSNANSPGLKHAFTDALRVALKRQGNFDWKAARNRLKKYYDR